jgi:hypothetical protein
MQVIATSEALEDEVLLRYRAAFVARGMGHHARWVDLELSGYDPAATARSLPTMLDGAPSSILNAVFRARVRRGRVRIEDGRIVTWPHFFVEPVRVLRDLGARIGPVAGEILIDLAPGHGEPPTVAFTGNVVLDVIDRIGVELRDALRSRM